MGQEYPITLQFQSYLGRVKRGGRSRLTFPRTPLTGAMTCNSSITGITDVSGMEDVVRSLQ